MKVTPQAPKKQGAIFVNPKILFTAQAWAEWDLMVQTVPGECSALAFADQAGATFTITEIVFLKQRNSGSNTELDQADMGKFMFEAMKAGKDMGKLVVWIHSHGTFQVFWSGTDAECIRILGGAASWFISVVTNKNGDTLARLDIFKPIHTTLDQLPVDVDYQLTEARKTELAALIAEKCGRAADVGFLFRGPEEKQEGPAQGEEEEPLSDQEVEGMVERTVDPNQLDLEPISNYTRHINLVDQKLAQLGVPKPGVIFTPARPIGEGLDHTDQLIQALESKMEALNARLDEGQIPVEKWMGQHDDLLARISQLKEHQRRKLAEMS